MRDVMIDLETFSTRPNAAILQIGACFFDARSQEPGIGRKFAANISLTSSLLAGLHIDQDTVAWWQKRKHHQLLGRAEPLGKVLDDFARWLCADSKEPGCKDVYIWSHGAAFDVPILESSYLAVGRKAPWHYRNVRDTRTLFWMAEQFGWAKPTDEAAHVGLDDAVAQAVLVQSANKAVTCDE